MASARGAVAVAVAAAVVGLAASPAGPASAAPTALTRNPYLTDATATSVRITWAAPAGSADRFVAWGPAGGSCAQYSTVATGVPFTVVTTSETSWTARLGNLAPASAYCYTITDGSTSVVAGPIRFQTLPASGGDAANFSFDVIGDTGFNGTTGSNPDQDRLYAEMASSGASFVLTTGDVAYPDGSQNNYGDLINTGANTSAVFGPDGWSTMGQSEPTFPVLGNHGRTATFLQNWPTSDALAASGGQYAMVTYPGQAGAATATYPTAYYAFDVGPARFYVLDADWTDSNVGTSTLYGQDYLNHWAPGDAEYEWLKADLAAHPGGLKFATFHFPLHSDNATETSDTMLQGTNGLEGLLAANGVDIVFNGHAHMYERNAPVIGSMVSYVTGGGGATLEPTAGHGCTSVDLYSIGWDPTAGVGSRCGTGATTPASPSQVYHFLHVSVSGTDVTVAPENALGTVFDQITYHFTTTAPTNETTVLPASADTYVYSGAKTTPFGSATPLLASAGSYRGLLRFDTSNIDPSATVTGVTLRLYSTVGLTGGGVQVHPSAGGWDEATTTWNSQPSWNTAVLSTSTTPSAPGWLTIPLPVSSVVAGGATNLGIGYSISGVIERLASREDPSNPPQLIVTTTGSPHPPPPATTTLVATADTYLYNGASTQNFGSATPLLFSAGSYRALLRFDTSAVAPTASISSLALRVYATVGLAPGGIQVRPEADGWTETGTSWSNQPAWSSQVLATSATQSTAGWVVIRLPASTLVAAGDTSLALSYSTAGMIERVASREDPAHAPQLVITTD
jgi:hypothetical protein